MKVKVKSLSCVWLFVTPWTVDYQTLLSMGLSRQEYWSGLPLPSPGDLCNPGMEPRSPSLQTDSLPAEPQGKSKNTRVGNLSLLQQIFLTQEPNRGLLHHNWIVYQLSCQGIWQDMQLVIIQYVDFSGWLISLSYVYLGCINFLVFDSSSLIMV